MTALSFSGSCVQDSLLSSISVQQLLNDAILVEALQPGAVSISQRLAVPAPDLARRLVPHFGRPEVAIGGDGSIGLLWHDDRTFYIDADFRADGRLHFFVRLNGTGVRVDILPSG